MIPWPWKRFTPAQPFLAVIPHDPLALQQLHATLTAQENHMAFFSEFEADFKKWFRKAPTVFHFANTVIAFAVPIVNQFLTLNDPAALMFVNPIISQIQSGLATASVIAGHGTDSTTLASTLSHVKDNFSEILSLAQVKDSANAAKLTANANLVIGELTAVIDMVNAPTSTATVTAAA